MKNIILSLVLLTFVFCYDLDQSEENKPKNYKLDLQQEEPVNLTLGQNTLNFKKDNNYSLNFAYLKYNSTLEDLLIYTNLQDVQDKISQFDIFNETLYPEKNILLTATNDKSGFLDIKIVPKDKYVINRTAIREDFYYKDNTINMFQGKEESKFFINIIPTDNNSDLYFFQTNKSSVRDDNKDRINLYYLNDFDGKNLDQIIEFIEANPMKRERCINGKVEIFGYSYKDLDKYIVLTKEYKQIKGTGILGPILSLSILFAALVVVVAFFIKNTYFEDPNKNK